MQTKETSDTLGKKKIYAITIIAICWRE